MDVKRTDSPARDNTTEEIAAQKAKKKTAQAKPVDKTARQQHREEVVDINSEHREKVQTLQDKHTRQLTQDRIKQKNSLEAQRTDARTKYQQAAAEQAKLEASQRQEHRLRLQSKDQEFEKQHSEFEKTKRQELEIQAESLQARQIDTRDRGEAAIKAQKEGYKDNFQKDQAYFEEYREMQRDHFSKEIDAEGKHFQDQIRGREDRFQDNFNENEVRYQLILEEQRLKYEDAYEKAKYEHLDKMKKFETSAKDPFYRVQDLGAKLTAEGPFYQIAVPVPEHELKNFKVHVQPDRITVSGQRKFEDEKKYEGEKLSTNSYQTVKQEFALPTPADKDLVRREYQDGILFVTAPKKGFGGVGKF